MAVKSAQVQADEAGKRLQRAREEGNRREMVAAEAVAAVLRQNKYIQQLEDELQQAVAQAKEAQEREEAQKASQDTDMETDSLEAVDAVAAALAAKHGELAEQVADQLDGVDLGPAAGPLGALLQPLAADRVNPPK
eukprot:9496156-Pyramimonas_sp.AAC.1